MSVTPQFSYFVSPSAIPVTESSAIWRQPLPLSRSLSAKGAASSMQHGEYFCAVRTFFENDGGQVLSRALAERLEQNVKPKDIRQIRVWLEKHGEFYHPARIEAMAHHQKISLVLNVAVSEMGKQYIQKEYHNLKNLNDKFSLSFLPRVYGSGEVKSAGNRKIAMFLGEWFEGYNEFHVSRNPSDNSNKILVWDDQTSRFFLSPEQSAKLYQLAARILTYYYNVESFEQIHPWHHAAGDFVVKIDNSGLDVKLITVRRYAPLFDNLSNLETRAKDAELTLQALLIFFLNLSIRMQLDRMDGVGDIIWADRFAVQSTLAGFFQGLAPKADLQYMPDSIDRCFMYYLSVCTKDDLYDLSNTLVNAFNPEAPEVPVVKQRLKEHVEALGHAIERMLDHRHHL